MATAAIARLTARHDCPIVTADTAEAFVNDESDRVSVLFFTGDPQRRPEANDVAVVLGELLKKHGDRLRAAIVDREAEEALKPVYGVLAMPSLVYLKDGGFLDVIPKIKDWSVYEEKTLALLDGAVAAAPIKH